MFKLISYFGANTNILQIIHLEVEIIFYIMIYLKMIQNISCVNIFWDLKYFEELNNRKMFNKDNFWTQTHCICYWHCSLPTSINHLHTARIKDAAINLMFFQRKKEKYLAEIINAYCHIVFVQTMSCRMSYLFSWYRVNRSINPAYFCFACLNVSTYLPKQTKRKNISTFL